MSDKRITQFLAKSPMASYAAMLDALRYLDGQWIWEDLEYELFHRALGDNAKRKVEIRVPKISGIPSNALLAFTWHAKKTYMLRRRTKKVQKSNDEPNEIVVFYKLTPAGKRMLKILDAIEKAKRR